MSPGHYIPTLARLILQRNKATQVINFKGFAVRILEAKMPKFSQFSEYLWEHPCIVFKVNSPKYPIVVHSDSLVKVESSGVFWCGEMKGNLQKVRYMLVLFTLSYVLNAFHQIFHVLIIKFMTFAYGVWRSEIHGRMLRSIMPEPLTSIDHILSFPMRRMQPSKPIAIMPMSSLLMQLPTIPFATVRCQRLMLTWQKLTFTTFMRSHVILTPVRMLG